MVVPPSAGEPAVPANEVASLAGAVSGTVLVPGNPGYAEECATFNLAYPRQPALAVGAASPADVSRAVRFAADHGMAVGVLATGHGASAPTDGALLVATSRMNGVTIDPVARTARVEAGTRWQQVIDAAAPHRLAPLSGSSPLVGAVGYTTGGGIGPVLSRSRGWAADHVRAFEIVTADGQLLRVDPEHHDDLFWAVRGGKDNFGIVTALECELFEVPRLYGGGLFFSGELAERALHAYRVWAPMLPEEMTASVALLRLPPLPEVPEPLRGKLTVHLRIAYLGGAAAAERLLEPARAVGPALIDTIADMSYQQVGGIHADPASPLPFHDASVRLAELSAGAAEAILRTAGPDSNCPLIMVEVRQLGGALSRAPEIPNAVAGREARFQVFCAGAGGPEDAPLVYTVIDDVFRGLRPWTTSGGTLNYLSARDSTPEGIRETVGKATYDRLAQVKRARDPENRFRLGQNIPPAR